MSRTLPFASWPEQDRAAWPALFAEGDVFDGRGPGALWSKATRQAAHYDYGRWLGFLVDHDPAGLSEPLADRVTPSRLRGYAQYLGGLSPITAASYLRRLLSVVRAVTPERNWEWIAEQARRLERRATPRDKRPRLVDANRALRLGIDLMARAEATSELTPAKRAYLYRDGLVIALLTCLPVRRRSLAAIRIGRHLERRGEHFLLVFAPEDTKSREPLTFPVPELLTPYLERYLTAFRPMIPGAARHDALWASAKGGALTGEGLYERICRHTRAAFGHAVNPHLFRSIAATKIAIEDPTRIGMASALLGHARLETTQRHYNQARAIEAGRDYQAILKGLRRETRRRGRPARRPESPKTES